jgi:transcriptional regulator with XRE-family HTH domain
MTPLSDWRIRRVLSMRDLAARARVAVGTINTIESGKREPSLRVIRAVSAALEVDPFEVDEFAAALGARLEGNAFAA